ncbi:MAG: hypothetical protein J5645_06765 [Lachnospiraceae bacterium]|nr:hypothetical protein [Lachnospiraceae bacterium]
MKQHPHWIRRTHVFRNDEFECSVCGARAERAARCCPKCGAAMKGVKSDSGWIDELEAADAFFDD